MINPIRKMYGLFGLIFPIIYLLLGRGFTLFLSVLSLVIVIIFEIYRKMDRNFNRKFFKKYSSVLKDSEKGAMLSWTWLLIGTFLTIFLFQKEIAILTLFFTSLGNFAASFVGTFYGRFSVGHKNAEGSVGMFIVCLITGLIFFSFGFIEFGLMLVGVFAATLFEFFVPGPYDNMLVSVLAAVVMSLV